MRCEPALAEHGDDIAIVVACSAFGTPPPPAVREEWADACRATGVPLLIDSAAGFGAAAEDGVAIGGQGDAEVVSFHATKPLAIGEGGAVFSRDTALIERMARLTNFGFDSERRPVERRGINAKLDELHAATAFGRARRFRREPREPPRPNLPDARSARLDGHPAARSRAQHRAVRARLPRATLRRATTCLRAPKGASRYASTTSRCTVRPRSRDRLGSDALTVTDDIGSRIISLPMAVDLTDDEIAEVVAVVTEAARG